MPTIDPVVNLASFYAGVNQVAARTPALNTGISPVGSIVPAALSNMTDNLVTYERAYTVVVNQLNWQMYDARASQFVEGFNAFTTQYLRPAYDAMVALGYTTTIAEFPGLPDGSVLPPPPDSAALLAAPDAMQLYEDYQAKLITIYVTQTPPNPPTPADDLLINSAVQTPLHSTDWANSGLGVAPLFYYKQFVLQGGGSNGPSSSRKQAKCRFACP